MSGQCARATRRKSGAVRAVRVFMALRVSHEAREDARTFFWKPTDRLGWGRLRACSSFAGQPELPALDGRAEFAILLLAGEVVTFHWRTRDSTLSKKARASSLSDDHRLRRAWRMESLKLSCAA